ncbi:uncharacterized protein LOC142180683 [Nicotiana tabacum]|uniref:Uncharacterized protein LOC142180683 n=1 Tax=Nicotiana tabacum TaxID=4097 RepID=A0AC58UH57_TOBAC
MIFADVDEFRDAVTKYSVQRKVQVKKYVNEPTRVRVRATRNYLCNSKYLAEVFKDKIAEQPNIRVFKLQQLIRKKFKVHVGKTTTRRARAKVLTEIMGDHILEFGRILDYRDELLRTNPESTCVVKLGEANESSKVVFQSFYVYFGALKNAFMGYRKCIGLDGCFLKGVNRGQLLVVVAKDSNNQMLPPARAIVEYENKNTWTWFVSLLKDDLGLGDGRGFTLITGMQKGFLAAIQDIIPACGRRMCARHILANWLKNWRGIQRRMLFWKCARSTYETELKKSLNALSMLGKNIVDDLLYYNKETWCKVYFNVEVKCDAVDNNIAESFNAWILDARHKTIIIMLEEIRVKMMTRISKLRKFANT